MEPKEPFKNNPAMVRDAVAFSTVFNAHAQYMCLKSGKLAAAAKVDESRRKEVGPDRACAEWLMKNGASIKWKGSKDYLKDYDTLLKTSTGLYIQAVDGTDSGINHIGFPYFEGCKHIEDIRLINCRYINDHAIPLLSPLKESLKYLEIRNCKSITEEGLHHLKHLKNLEVLKISELPYGMVAFDSEHMIRRLMEYLPNCKIQLE